MERLELKLENKGNCLFCKTPSVKEHSLQALLQYLQMRKVEVEMKVEPGERERANFITMDLDAPDVKAGLCEECGDHLETFVKAKEELEMTVRACLASIQSKMEVGREKNDMTTEYPIQEGTIVKEALTRLKKTQPRVVPENLQLPEASDVPPAVVKIENDDQAETTEDSSSIRDLEKNEGGHEQMETTEDVPIILSVKSIQPEEDKVGEADNDDSTSNNLVDAKDAKERGNEESSTSGNDLANENLREMEKSFLWKPTFGTIQELWVDALIQKRGTDFITPGEITRFMRKMEGTSNPLPSGTVIFIPALELKMDQHINFQAQFCKFLDAFKNEIFHLVYVFNFAAIPSEEDLFNQFRGILKLKNLRSLVIDKFGGAWEQWLQYDAIRSQMFEFLASNKEILPEKLTEFQIGGLSGSIPISYMFGGMESILNSVSSVSVSNNGSSVDLWPVFSFPNLKKLKLSLPNAKLLKKFQQFKPNSVASLKEISLFFESEFYRDRGSTVDFALKETFELLDIHAETLEFLHLDFGSDHCIWKSKLPRFTSVQYTNLKRLSLQFHYSHCWLAEIRELMAKFVNPEEVHVFLNFNGGTNRKIMKMTGCKNVVAFWDLLPATVETIHFPDYGWKLKPGENLQFNLNNGNWEIDTRSLDSKGDNKESSSQARFRSKKRKLKSSEGGEDEEAYRVDEPNGDNVRAAQNLPRGRIITLRRLPQFVVGRFPGSRRLKQTARKSTGGIAPRLLRR